MKISCHLWVLVLVMAKDSGCISSNVLGNPPEKATNFKCRSFYWRNLTCTWSTPKTPAPVSYSLYYGPASFNSVQPFLCSKKLNATACGWTRNGEGGAIYLPLVENFVLVLNGTNGIGKNTSQVFKLHHWSIIIPGEPEDLWAAGNSPTQLLVNWKYPKDFQPTFFPPGVCYRVEYRASYQQNFTSQDTGINESNMTLTGLTPNTWYTIKVKARSCSADADFEKDLWGPFNTINIKTKADIPWTSPPAHEALFDVVNSNSSRNVTVYWKHLHSIEENGDNFHYELSIVQTFLNRKRRDTKSLERISVGKNNSMMFPQLDKDSAYMVMIWSANRIGSSLNFTRIIIPKNSKMPSRPLHVRPVSKGDGEYHVSWHPSSETIKSYVLVWCQGGKRCKFDLNWMIANASTSSVTLQLEDNKNYGFGVSVISSEDGLSSGLEWAPCTAYSNRGLGSVTSIRAESKSHSILISWKLACEAQKTIINHYKVSICKNSCHSCDKGCKPCTTEEKTHVLRNPEADSKMFEDLIPYSSYSYSVIAVSERGDSSERFWRCVATLSDAPSDPPHLVEYSKVTNSSLHLSWAPPINPNGVIDRYVIYYKEVSARMYQHTAEVSKSVPADPLKSKQEFELEGLKCFTNYSVKVSACVGFLCSNSSSPHYLKTEIGVPGTMDPPRTEVVNSSHVRVIWKAPEHPNGPVDCYLLHLFKREFDNITRLDLINVTGTSVEVPSDCSPEVHTLGEGMHLFRVQALNLVPGQKYLYGPISNATETKLCLMGGTDIDSVLVTGIIIGSTLALAIVIISLYFVVRWMKMKVDKMKKFDVILPDGLQQPYSNSYENFKKGLSSQASEPNLSPKLGYGRMDSFNSDSNSDDSFKNRHGSGTSHFSATSNDELINKSSQGGQVTAPKSFSGAGQKNTQRGDRNPSGDNSSGHDSILSSMTHRTTLSSDGSSCSEEPGSKGKELQTEQDYKFDKENKADSVLHCSTSLPNSHYLPITPYSKLCFAEGGRLGDYLPLARGRHLSAYGHNLANSEPSITDLSPDSYTSELSFQDPPSPDVPYSKFGMSHSVTDLILEGMELPESPLSQTPSPHEALPYSRFGLRRLAPPNQGNPYVTMGMAFVLGPQKDPNQLLASKAGAHPFILKPPFKKNTVLEQPAELSSSTDEAYSKLGLGSVEEPEDQAKFQPYLTMKEVKENEQNNSLPDLTVSSREGSPSRDVQDHVQHKEQSESVYLPHQLIPAVVKTVEPALPDLVSCSNILPVDSQELPGVKVQEGSGYVSLNQVLSNSPNV